MTYTGSALADRLISERARIHAEWAGRSSNYEEAYEDAMAATIGVNWEPELFAHRTTPAPLDDLYDSGKPRRIWLKDIIRLVAARFNINVRDLKSHRRHASIIRPRQIAMYLARQLTSLSFPQIAMAFDKRDHTTVLHSVRRIESLIVVDEVVAEQVSELMRLMLE